MYISSKRFIVLTHPSMTGCVEIREPLGNASYNVVTVARSLLPGTAQLADMQEATFDRLVERLF